MEASPRIRAFIKMRERLSLTAYLCPAGKWTIGWGHTGKEVGEGLVITQPMAEAVFNSDIDTVEQAIEWTVNVKLSQPMFDALVSFVFNIGVEAWRKSTMLYKLNKGDVEGAAAQFGRWVYGTVDGQKKVLPGLVARRHLEQKIFTEAEG